MIKYFLILVFCFVHSISYAQQLKTLQYWDNTFLLLRTSEFWSAQINDLNFSNAVYAIAPAGGASVDQSDINSSSNFLYSVLDNRIKDGTNAVKSFTQIEVADLQSQIDALVGSSGITGLQATNIADYRAAIATNALFLDFISRLNNGTNGANQYTILATNDLYTTVLVLLTSGTNAIKTFTISATNDLYSTLIAALTTGTNANRTFTINATNDLYTTLLAKITSGTNAAIGYSTISTNVLDTTLRALISLKQDNLGFSAATNGGTIFPTQINYTNSNWSGPTNAITLNNNYQLYSANTNVSITNVTGNVSGSFSWTTLFVSNSLSVSITQWVNNTSFRLYGSGSSNPIIIPAGKIGVTVFSSYGVLFTNYYNAVQQ